MLTIILLDDLNPLYVYEAKMSMFTRMAQTRPGAERLLEAQTLPILAQCEFLDTRPEEDQSFMGTRRVLLL
jgi:nuclear pore complex protein Nup205